MRKPNHKSAQDYRRCSDGKTDRRGSAIVLVLISCVLMAILAGTLLQLARFERIPQKTSNIDAVVESVIAETINQLTDDILDTNGRVFNIQNTGRNNGGDEPYDFPWTNTFDALGGGNFYGRTYEDGSTTYKVMGGSMDDTWLAATAPDFRATAGINTINRVHGQNLADSTNGVWRKISSLTGVFLGGDNGSSDFSTLDIPNRYPIDGAATPTDPSGTLLHTDTCIPTISDMLVDADGDGIGDSRWEWAPLRQIGATQYIMAVRIVDLSAKADLNVATGFFTNQDAGLPRGDSPGELNGLQFALDFASGSAISDTQAESNWRNILNFRLTGNQSSSAGAIADNSSGDPEFAYDGNQSTPRDGSRMDYWTNGSSLVNNLFSRNGVEKGAFKYSGGSTFGMADALELLYRNGLNNDTSSPLEQVAPAFMRDGPAELAFNATSGTPAGGLSQREFWIDEPRKHLSPFTGSANTAPPHDTNLDHALRVDVNEAYKTSNGRNQIYKVIRDVVDATERPNDKNNFLDLFPQLSSNVNSPGRADVDRFVSQLTANIADYIDDDNQITRVGQRGGFEALPYIGEVYAQRLYRATAVNSNGAGNPVINWRSGPNNTAKWRMGFVVEIGNPFARLVSGTWVGRPVSLNGVYISLTGSNNAVELATLDIKQPDGSDWDPEDFSLEPGDVLLVWRNSTGNTVNQLDILEEYHKSTNNTTGTMRVFTAELPQGTQNPPPEKSPQTFELFAEIQGTDVPASWAYAGCEVKMSVTAPNPETLGGTTSTSIAPGHLGYVRTHVQGFSHGLQMMAVDARTNLNNGYEEDVTSLDKPSLNCNETSGDPEFRQQFNTTSQKTELGKEDKSMSPNIFSNISDAQIVWPDNPRERMQWAGDILQIPLLGFAWADSNKYNTRMARCMWGAANRTTNLAGGIEQLYMKYRVNKAPDGTVLAAADKAQMVNPEATLNYVAGRAGVLNLPHALMIMERLCTHSPATDGRDGDGNGGSEAVTSPNYSELLVPGRLNINTATRETIEALLPIPDADLREDYALEIVRRREALKQFARYKMGANDIPGIQYTSSMYEQLADIATSPSKDGSNNTDLNGFRIDLNDFEEVPGAYPLNPDGIADDREEELMVMKWISEMTSTRSDVFAAYIVVQGYDADQFTNGATESARVIVLFSRANVRNDTDRAVEIGRLRIE